jgi:hypothetical protein
MESIISATSKFRSSASAARSVPNLNEDFERSRGDVGQLERLRDELEALKANKETWVLRLKVTNALLAARKYRADAVSAPKQMTLRRGYEAAPMVPHDLTAFLAAIELVWRDLQSRAAHDRRRLMVLPADAELHATALPATRACAPLRDEI